MADTTKLAAGGPRQELGAQKDSRARGNRAPELVALAIVLAALVVFFAVKSPYFLTVDNGISIIQAIAVIGIIAVPGTMLIIGGQFDLSVGSAVATCGVVMAIVSATGGLWLGVIASLAAGALIGLVNGILVMFVGVNALITTLGTMSVLAGAAELFAGGQTKIFPGFSGLGTSEPIPSVPTPVLIYIGIVLVGAAVMRFTVFGRSVYSIGSNQVAARLVGINVRKVMLIAFVASGLAAALGGLIVTSRLGAASPTAGGGMELSVLAAIVLGGASLGGGRGSIVGTLLGLIIIGVLNNGLVLLNVNSFYQNVASGTLLILAVSFDQLRRRVLHKGT